MSTALDVDPDNLVTLKVHGKSYACSGTIGGKKCKSKDFLRGTQVDLIAREHDHILYRCVACALVVSGPHIEEQLPPRNDWRTPGGTEMQPRNPPGLWDTLHREYRFRGDVAASATNTKCRLFYDGSTPDLDGLLTSWTFGRKLEPGEDYCVYDNPPYLRGAVEAWLAKALEQAALGVKSVHLIPMASSVGWFNDLVVPYAEWHTFRGRIAFEDPLASDDASRTNPKQDNLLVIFDPYSSTIGHTAVRDARTGKRLWTRPGIILPKHVQLDHLEVTQ